MPCSVWKILLLTQSSSCPLLIKGGRVCGDWCVRSLWEGAGWRSQHVTMPWWITHTHAQTHLLIWDLWIIWVIQHSIESSYTEDWQAKSAIHLRGGCSSVLCVVCWVVVVVCGPSLDQASCGVCGQPAILFRMDVEADDFIHDDWWLFPLSYGSYLSPV